MELLSHSMDNRYKPQSAFNPASSLGGGGASITNPTSYGAPHSFWPHQPPPTSSYPTYSSAYTPHLPPPNPLYRSSYPQIGSSAITAPPPVFPPATDRAFSLYNHASNSLSVPPNGGLTTNLIQPDDMPLDVSMRPPNNVLSQNGHAVRNHAEDRVLLKDIEPQVETFPANLNIKQEPNHRLYSLNSTSSETNPSDTTHEESLPQVNSSSSPSQEVPRRSAFIDPAHRDSSLDNNLSDDRTDTSSNSNQSSPFKTDPSTSSSSSKKRPTPVPENQKDTGYWEKRAKNNMSAKRSRDQRRTKEEQIAMRVVYLEQENLQLKTEVSILRTEIDNLRRMVYNT